MDKNGMVKPQQPENKPPQTVADRNKIAAGNMEKLSSLSDRADATKKGQHKK